MFLLDTDVLSGLRRQNRNRGLSEWIASQRTVDLHLSVVTVGEIERGISFQRERDAESASALASWLDQVLEWYGDRIVDIDVATARRWGKLSAMVGNSSADLLIAATALERGLTVVTRNVRHYEATGVDVLNPFRD